MTEDEEVERKQIVECCDRVTPPTTYTIVDGQPICTECYYDRR